MFSLVVIPTLLLMGLITFERLLLAAFTIPLWITTSAGVVTFLLRMTIHQRYQWRQWMRQTRTMPVLFPSQPRP